MQTRDSRFRTCLKCLDIGIHWGLPVGFLLPWYSALFNVEVLSPYLCFISFLYLDLYVLGDDALIS